uniref:J domain-containing protein n=1 Tax=Panagrolaimus sp. ES5 TaxID=591445 RepID=A0AC34FI14_9BILA
MASAIKANEFVAECQDAFGTSDLYLVLGITRDEEEGLTYDKLKKAYHKQLLRWHPDKFPTAAYAAREDSPRKFRILLKVYMIMSDPEKKESYDQDGLLHEDWFTDIHEPNENNVGTDGDSEESSDEPMEFSEYEDSNADNSSDISDSERERELDNLFVAEEEMGSESGFEEADGQNSNIPKSFNDMRVSEKEIQQEKTKMKRENAKRTAGNKAIKTDRQSIIKRLKQRKWRIYCKAFEKVHPRMTTRRFKRQNNA